MHCPSPSRPNCFPLLFFITGYHHSGTTWLRAEMLRKLGFNNSAINATLRELWQQIYRNSGTNPHNPCHLDKLKA